MKILFFMRSTIYVRNFEATLRLLAERGHEVHVLADPHSLAESNDLVDRLCRDYPGIRHSAPPAVAPSAFSFLGLELRRGMDYLRYLGPEFAEAPKLRARAERSAPAFVTTALGLPLAGTGVGRRVLSALMRMADIAVPRDPSLEAFIREQAPDLVLVTPLVEPGAPQAEYLRAARACGVRTGLCVYSWDNLTNKGLIHDPLDLITVWNEPMKHEAITLHGVSADRIVVTGSPAYDHWFTWKPGGTREAFCAQIGLRADRPYLLYLCSSKFIAPQEVPFIRRWVGELRAGSPALRDAGVLVRPHPQNAEQWETADLSDLDEVVVWPSVGANPVDTDSRTDYYDSIYHSAAVVGVNTSAQIESAIVGRGVYTVLADEFRDTQEGTLHFRHLRHVNGGLLHVGETFAEHATQLEAAVAGQSDDTVRCRRFVEAFVRPHGLADAVTPRLVSALEAVAARGPVPRDRGPWWGVLLRPVLARLAVRLAGSERGQRDRAARRERLRDQQAAARIAQRAEQVEAKRRAGADRDRRRQEAETRLDVERRQRDDAAARACERHREVREWMQRWGEADLPAVVLSDAERQMVAALRSVQDGAPEVLANLRHWCEPITGVRASDYESLKPEVKGRLKRDLLLRHRRDALPLFVSESTLLGGFGYSKHNDLYNEDTLRHFVTLVALKDAGVLGDYRGGGERRLVWEIGGGWGGFARQFKTICPDVTYLITGTPEQMLVAAVYLTTVFPAAHARFYDPAAPCELFRDWQTTDFLFAPEAAVPSLRVPRLDLAVDVSTLHRMSAERVAMHVRQAYEWGGRYFYSQQPASQGEDESLVSAAMAPWFWLHPVSALAEAEGPAAGATADGAGGGRGAVDDLHVVGWRRIRT